MRSILLKERITIAKRKPQRPLNAFQFNALAIVLILVVVPFGIAFVSNAGSTQGASYEDGIDIFEPGINPYGYYLENGDKNYSSLYSGICAHVVDGICSDTGAANYVFLGNAANSFFTPSQSLTLPDSHFKGSNQGSDPYVGESGDGPFSWFFINNFFNALPNNEGFDKLKFSFIDLNNQYNCESHTWVDLVIESSIILEFEGEELKIEGIFTETDNRYRHFPYPVYHEVCNVGFDIEFDFTSFESLQINDFNNGFMNETNMTFTIDKIERKDGLNLVNTELPFAGTDDFQISLEYSSIDTTQANFFIKMGTLALTVVVFLVAIASTPYWDPFKNTFRGLQ